MAHDGHVSAVTVRAREGSHDRRVAHRREPRTVHLKPVVAPYPASLRLLHWLTLVLVLAAITLGLLRAQVEGHALRLWLLDAHRLLGLLVFGVTALRLVRRLSRPVEPTPLPPLIGYVAHTTHGLLYLLLFAMPLLGVLLSNARSASTRLFGVLPLPLLMGENADLADLLQTLHHLGGWLLIGLVGLHAGAALFHHCVLKDGVLGRMLPRLAAPRRRRPGGSEP